VHREAWLLGEKSTEVFFPTGDPNAPIARIGNAFMEIGCAAAKSAAKLGERLYWLATNDEGGYSVVRTEGFTALPVSTPAIDHAIAQYARVDDAVAISYTQEGHRFYCLSFPTGGTTWVFDATVGLWHQRAYRDPVSATLEPVLEQCQMAFAGKVLVGSRVDGSVYELDLGAYTDDGDPIVRRRRCSYIGNAQGPVRHHRLELVMTSGVGDGDPTSQGYDPQAVLRWSDDAGKTWTSERLAALGKIGENPRIAWRRLGSTETARVYEVTITDPVRVEIVDAVLTAMAG
jgi:hypothetical protein